MTGVTSDSSFEALLEYVKRSRGFDFTGYKRASLMRRVTRRMQIVGVEGYSNYLDYLEVHPDEFAHLFNTLLINVTSFFRDRAAWDYLRSDIIPRIIASKDSQEPIRIWSAACASGEEAYTIVIVIAEMIGFEQFRERVKIYATDIDDEALNQARQATYQPKDMHDLSPEQLEQFFERSDNSYTFRKDLRRSVIFGRHDLIQDAPISKIDLLVCRNALMYFNAETQARILSRFHFALQNEGFLFLGKAEMLLTHAHTFTPVHIKCRIFSKVAKLNLRDRLSVVTQTGNGESSNHLAHQGRLREAAFESNPIACIVIDANGSLALSNERARTWFNLTRQDLGRPLRDLEISYRPLELRSCIEQVYTDRRAINHRDVAWEIPQGEILYLNVLVQPLFNPDQTILGVSVHFMDDTRYKRLQDNLEHTNQELEMAYEELQSTNEELETTNEELQSSNEEMETTNEELQSTNEELETMNEELQSTNEELQTVNHELQQQGEELNKINFFLESILTSLKGGVVVVDRDLRVQIWNYKAEDLWGVRAEEAIDQNFLNLDIGLPTEQLRQSIRNCLARADNPNEILLQAINRRGRSITCRIACSPLIDRQSQTQGVIMLMEEREEE